MGRRGTRCGCRGAGRPARSARSLTGQRARWRRPSPRPERVRAPRAPGPRDRLGAHGLIRASGLVRLPNGVASPPNPRHPGRAGYAPPRVGPLPDQPPRHVGQLVQGPPAPRPVGRQLRRRRLQRRLGPRAPRRDRPARRPRLPRPPEPRREVPVAPGGGLEFGGGARALPPAVRGARGGALHPPPPPPPPPPGGWWWWRWWGIGWVLGPRRRGRPRPQSRSGLSGVKNRGASSAGLGGGGGGIHRVRCLWRRSGPGTDLTRPCSLATRLRGAQRCGSVETARPLRNQWATGERLRRRQSVGLPLSAAR